MRSYSFNKVNVTDSLFRRRMDVNKAYLKELDDTCLLQNYYFEAGIIIPGLMMFQNPEDVKLHWGWEAPSCQLRGHFLGHYLSAASMIVANDGDEILAAKLRHIISELKRCQELNGGRWAGPIPEKYFEVLTTDRYIWSPQYTIHKLLMGLVDTYKYTGNEEALEILSGMGDWFLDWTRDMRVRCPDAIFKGEQAGMLEVWADAYAVTGDKKYLKIADAYKGQRLFKLIEVKGVDALTDDHTNASIPIIQGAAKMYEITGRPMWRKIVESFWDAAVTERGMYATTGQNAGEFWIPPKKMGEYRGERNQEFCTVYNMVRVAEYLFKWTGDSKYSDYIERCIYNGFLAQQNAENGMPDYFLSLTTGSKKEWATKTRDFWCCQGTLIQSAAKYPEMIYSVDDDSSILYVNQYISSVLEERVGETEIKLTQSLSMKGYDAQTLFDEHGTSEKSRWRFHFDIEIPSKKGKKSISLALRIPEWASGDAELSVNGKIMLVNKNDDKLANGYVIIPSVKNGAAIDISFVSEVKAERLPDDEGTAAFVDGPIVLAGLTSDVDVIYGDFENPGDFLSSVSEHTYDTYIWLQNNYRTKKQPRSIKFVPLYDVKDEAYTIYFEERK